MWFGMLIGAWLGFGGDRIVFQFVRILAIIFWLWSAWITMPLANISIVLSLIATGIALMVLIKFIKVARGNRAV